MTKARPQVLALNGGEVDREVIVRSDLESYANKAEIVENLLPSLKGGLFRAPGSRFLGFTLQGPGEDLLPALVTWRFSRTQAFTIEIDAGSIRLIYGLGFVQTGDGAASFDGGGWDDHSTGGGSIDPNAPPWSLGPGDPGFAPPSAPVGGGGPTGGIFGAGGFGGAYDPPSEATDNNSAHNGGGEAN